MINVSLKNKNAKYTVQQQKNKSEKVEFVKFMNFFAGMIYYLQSKEGVVDFAKAQGLVNF